MVDPEGLNPVVGAAARILGPTVVSEILNPTIRQTQGLPDGVLGATGFSEDGDLVILIDKDSDLATKINALSHECVHYSHLRGTGNVKIPGSDIVKSEMVSEIVDSIVGAFIPPGNGDLRAYQDAVRNDLINGNLGGIMFRTMDAHNFDLLFVGGSHSPEITLPEDARR